MNLGSRALVNECFGGAILHGNSRQGWRPAGFIMEFSGEGSEDDCGHKAAHDPPMKS